MTEHKYSDLFRYRNVWMGFAILWIIVYHSELPVDNRLLWMVKNVGYCGVDIFFFASGIGCFYSFRKTPDPWEFMKKRLRRIIPTYWVFLVFWLLFHFIQKDLIPGTVIGNIFCLEYFMDPELDRAFNWYMGAVWVMYLLVPYFYGHIIRRKEKSLRLIMLLLVISVTFWHSDNLILLATKTPVFFLGMYFGFLGTEDRIMSWKAYLIQFACFMAGFLFLVPMRLLVTDNTIMWGCGLLFYPFLLMTPFICFTISLIAENQIPGIKEVIVFLETAGRWSFELYLMHHLVFDFGFAYLNHVSFYMTRRWWWLLYLLVIPCTYVLRKLTELITHQLHIR